MPVSAVHSQVPPSDHDLASYSGLLAAAARGDVAGVSTLLASGEDPGQRDGSGRTPLHIATHAGHHDVMKALVLGGADPNALEGWNYDILTIAAVAGDEETLELALALGCSPDNVTSPWQGTALIAAAHLGHVEVVKILVKAGSPLDHVNILGWTALIEAIVLGDGGQRYVQIVEVLLGAGADPNLPDSRGYTPLALARAHGFDGIAAVLESTVE